MTDITDRKRVEAQLAHLASHDPLTNLLNRRSFQTELTRHLAQSMRYGSQGALLLLDLDHFKDFNDTLGHAAGDEFLVNLAGVLRERLRATDLVARLGGDEFAVLLPHTDGHQAYTVATHLLHAVRCHAVAVEAESIGLTVSLGIVLIPDYGATAEELMAQADLALYQAKANGRNCLAVYSPDRDWPAKAEPRLGWRQRIRDAVERDRFILDAQPVLHLGENRVSQYELLLRMVDERGEIIPPSAFLGIAEQYGLIRDVDRWVVRRAIQMLAQQKRAGRDMRFEVNLSAKAFADADLLPLIKDELQGASISPESLVLEVTEAAAIANRYLAQGKRLTDTVETTLLGRLFDPPFRMAPAGRSAAQWDTPIHAAAADFSAFKSDDQDWILENFIPEEGSAVLSFLNDPALHEKNRKVFEGRMERYITGEASYKEYALVFVRDIGQNSSFPFTFKHTPTGWKRTNQLAADEILDIVFSALANGGEVTVQP